MGLRINLFTIANNWIIISFKQVTTLVLYISLLFLYQFLGDLPQPFLQIVVAFIRCDPAETCKIRGWRHRSLWSIPSASRLILDRSACSSACYRNIRWERTISSPLHPEPSRVILLRLHRYSKYLFTYLVPHQDEYTISTSSLLRN